jgi:G patch domain-containing protein 1
VKDAGQQQTTPSAQRPEDFMDDEDLAEHNASQRIETVDTFAILGGPAGISAKSSNDEDSGLFAQVFHTPSATTTERKGYELLRRMKWRPGQGIGAMVRRRADGDRTGELHLFAPQEVPMVTFARKTDRHGIGYGEVGSIKLMPVQQPRREPTRRKFGLGAGGVKGDDEDDLDEFGPRITMPRAVGGADKKKKKKKVLESTKEDASRSSKLLALPRKTASRTCHDGRPPLRGFIPALRPLVTASPSLLEAYAPPAVPAGWISSHQPRDTTMTTTINPSTNNTPYRSTKDVARASTLDPRARAALLGEQLLPGKSVFDFLSPANRARIVAATGNNALPAAGNEALPSTSSTGQPLNELERLWSLVPPLSRATAAGALARGEKGWMPYGEDEAKRSRYRAFLQLRAAAPPSVDDPPLPLPFRPPTLSVHDWAQELREFAAAAEVFRPATGLLGKRFTAAVQDPTVAPPTSQDSKDDRAADSASANDNADPAEKAAQMGMHGALTRSRARFYPNRLICKRFGVRPPPDAGPEMPGARGGSGGGGDDNYHHNSSRADFDSGETAATAAVARLELVGRATLEKIMIEANLKRMEARNAVTESAVSSASPAGVAGEADLVVRHDPAPKLLPMHAIDAVSEARAEVNPELNEALEKEKPDEALYRAIFGDSDDDN